MKKNNLKTFHFDFELINEEATKEKKIIEKPGINIDSLLLKKNGQIIKKKIIFHLNKKREIKTIKLMN